MELTDRSFWLNYWEQKKDLIYSVNDDLVLTEILAKIIVNNSIKTSLEIGGFPGHYSIYLKKKFNIDVTLLDYVIHEDIIKKLLSCNRLEEEELIILEANIFKFKESRKYNLVFSNGLIEHFDDTKLIIQKHTDLLSSGGVLFLSLPNFKSLNGWFQKKFDLANYEKHNINSMDLELLKSICQELGLKNIDVKYHGNFMLWLENIDSKSFLFKGCFKVIWFIFKVIFKIIPINTKAFSPYIVLTAIK